MSPILVWYPWEVFKEVCKEVMVKGDHYSIICSNWHKQFKFEETEFVKGATLESSVVMLNICLVALSHSDVWKPTFSGKIQEEVWMDVGSETK